MIATLAASNARTVSHPLPPTNRSIVSALSQRSSAMASAATSSPAPAPTPRGTLRSPSGTPPATGASLPAACTAGPDSAHLNLGNVLIPRPTLRAVSRLIPYIFHFLHPPSVYLDITLCPWDLRRCHFIHYGLIADLVNSQVVVARFLWSWAARKASTVPPSPGVADVSCHSGACIVHRCLPGYTTSHDRSFCIRTTNLSFEHDVPAAAYGLEHTPFHKKEE